LQISKKLTGQFAIFWDQIENLRTKM